MKAYLCIICGHLQFDKILNRCPRCGADEKEFRWIDDYLEKSKNNHFHPDFR